EKARLQAAAGSKEGFDHAGADRLYAEAFEGYGLDVTALGPEEAAERIRTSAIRARLVVALDGWASVKNALQRGGEAPLWAVADLADDDEWSRRLRGAVRRGGRAELERLVDQGAARQPPANLVLLARALGGKGNWAASERLLRPAQRAQPADFWL